MQSIIIHFSCIDKPGIVAGITSIIYKNDGNILSLEQHVEPDNLFFMRIRIEMGADKIKKFSEAINSFATQLKADLDIRVKKTKPKVAILVSTQPHCLLDILARNESGEINCEIKTIMSDKENLKDVAARYNIPFHFFPAGPSHEAMILKVLEQEKIDLVVLARYMRILSPDFVDKYTEKIINIHHSFLPAFKGSRPYHRAWERGVKVIGATAHYATPELDEGPIIAQDVKPFSHHHSIESLVESGREIEKNVLASAIKAWLEDRIVVHDRRTIIFNQY